MCTYLVTYILLRHSRREVLFNWAHGPNQASPSYSHPPTAADRLDGRFIYGPAAIAPLARTGRPVLGRPCSMLKHNYGTSFTRDFGGWAISPPGLLRTTTINTWFAFETIQDR